jgi:hypothetical protein
MFALFIGFSYQKFNDLKPIPVFRELFFNERSSPHEIIFDTTLSEIYTVSNSFFVNLALTNENGAAIIIVDYVASFSISDSAFLHLTVINGQGGAIWCSAKTGIIGRVCRFQCQAHRNEQALGQFTYFKIDQTNGNIALEQIVVFQCAPNSGYNSPDNTRAPIYLTGNRLNSKSLNQSSCWVNSFSGIILLEDRNNSDFQFCYFFDNHMTLAGQGHEFFDQFNFKTCKIKECNFISNIGSLLSLIVTVSAGGDALMNIISCFLRIVVYNIYLMVQLNGLVFVGKSMLLTHML